MSPLESFSSTSPSALTSSLPPQAESATRSPSGSQFGYLIGSSSSCSTSSSAASKHKVSARWGAARSVQPPERDPAITIVWVWGGSFSEQEDRELPTETGRISRIFMGCTGGKRQ